MTHVRGANRALVLQNLRMHSQLSRAELARRTGLSEGAVSRISAELLQEQLIEEQGAENSTGGRPGTRLALDKSHHLSVGVDIRPWESRVSLGTIQGHILETQWFRTPASASRTLNLVVERVSRLHEKVGSGRLHGIGIGVRGIVDHERGVVEVGSSAQWDNVAVKAILEEKLNLPVCVENNVRAAALAQYNHGNLDIFGRSCMLFIRVDEGIGMGIVMDGRLYRGTHRSAGEIGQMVVADSPGAGAQDRVGCLESLAANPAILSRFMALGEESRNLSGETESRVRTLCHMAREGDARASRAIRESIRYLGIAIANLIWAWNADVIVLDGAITDGWPLVVDVIREQFPPGREFHHFHNLALRPCALGQDAGIVGALALPFVTLFATGEISTFPVPVES